ncbi:MAG: type II pantothenate kinase [Lachnospiraceae bacterium]
MQAIVGIDIGGSTTKIAGFCGVEMLESVQVKASTPVASLFGAFGQFMMENNLALEDIAQIRLTGVGSDSVTQDIYGIPTYRVDEFVANGLGGRFFAKQDKAVVVSMGTGTSFVLVEGEKLSYLGGIAIGGGTMMGLSKLLLNIQDVKTIKQLSLKGDVEHIDLRIKDISKEPLPGLDLDITASNFGKVDEMATREDIAAAIVHMVLESIFHTGTLVAQDKGVDEFILIGSMASIEQCADISSRCAAMAGEKVHFVIPQKGGFATAIGAASAMLQDCTRI